MWIERFNKKNQFVQAVESLRAQVLVVRGARQVGKTSFINNALEGLKGHRIIRINLATKQRATIDGLEYFGRDFFGTSDDASQFLHNMELITGDLKKQNAATIVFIDEADRHPVSLEAIQMLAGRSDVLKVIYTGSNLENIPAQNAATGRKRYFDLYPITFREFLSAYSKDDEFRYVDQISVKDKMISQMHHHELLRLFDIYLRLGGMPRILDAFIDVAGRAQPLPEIMADIIQTVEENVKTVLGPKSSLYEYEDVLRKIALLSMETLKFSKLQVQHAGRAEAKRLVNKTVGARVAHKVRLYESGSDLSKYMIFDAGVLNCLLNGADILQTKITDQHMAIQCETAVGNEIVATLPSRDDLFYWKSARGAQVEFLLRSPRLAAIDVKTTRGDVKSLDSCAVFQKEIDCIVKVSREIPNLDAEHTAVIPSLGLSRKMPLLTIPQYLSGRLTDLLSEVM